MIEAIVSGLVVAAVSGLTFLSYKHHDGYKIISDGLKKLYWYVLIGVFCYHIGFTKGKYADEGQIEAFSIWWALGSLIGLLIFLGFLDLLPELTRRKDDNDES